MLAEGIGGLDETKEGMEENHLNHRRKLWLPLYIFRKSDFVT